MLDAWPNDSDENLWIKFLLLERKGYACAVGYRISMAVRIARLIVGIALMVTSALWFVWALGIAMRQSNFINAVGWAVPFVILLISIYIAVSAATTGPLRAVLGLAVCGFVLVIGGTFVWIWRSDPRFSPMSSVEASVFGSAIGIGALLIVLPSSVYLMRRARARSSARPQP